MQIDMIPFNKPYLTGKELVYITEALNKGEVKGDGRFTKICHKMLEDTFQCKKALLTHSCTAALEMSALLLDLKSDDEVIVPSYAFPSTANAFCLRGAKIVFVDVRRDNLNLDESLIERAITNKTKAICVLHYAGVACEMDAIYKLAAQANVKVVEDAAQAVFSKYKGKFCGALGDLGAYSFHETKNFSSGEGGAILINNPDFIERAEIIREKGTNRSKFFRGEVDKYSWVDLGSSFLPSDIIAAYLYGQLEGAEYIQGLRKAIWERYFFELKHLQDRGLLRLPHIPKDCEQNYHMFYLLCRTEKERDSLMKHLRDKGVYAVFHYFPLHLSKMGQSFGYKPGDLKASEEVASTILRLPLFCSLTSSEQTKVLEAVGSFYR